MLLTTCIRSFLVAGSKKLYARGDTFDRMGDGIQDREGAIHLIEWEMVSKIVMGDFESTGCCDSFSNRPRRRVPAQ